MLKKLLATTVFAVLTTTSAFAWAPTPVIVNNLSPPDAYHRVTITSIEFAAGVVHPLWIFQGGSQGVIDNTDNGSCYQTVTVTYISPAGTPSTLYWPQGFTRCCPGRTININFKWNGTKYILTETSS